jgi:hypothetical protein
MASRATTNERRPRRDSQQTTTWQSFKFLPQSFLILARSDAEAVVSSMLWQKETHCQDDPLFGE